MAGISGKVNWRAISSGDRNIIIESVKQAISKSDGYILNFQLFSDLALSLTIEIEEKQIPALYQALSPLLNLIEPLPANLNSHSEKEWWVLMNITFSQGTGDVSQEVPMVPG